MPISYPARPWAAGPSLSVSGFFRLLGALGLAGLTALAVSPAAAQVAPVSPRVQSFAGAASDGIACGAEALAANPARLAAECTGPTRILLLPTLRLTAWSNGDGLLLLENADDLLEPASLPGSIDPATRRELLASIGADGVSHGQRLDLPLFQFSGRRSAASVTLTTSARGTIARDLAVLVLDGHREGRLDYSLADTRQEVESYFTLAIGHGRRIGDYDVGVTGHLMAGMVLSSWQAFDPTFKVGGRAVRAEVIGMYAGEKALEASFFDVERPDGLGAGLDIGVTREHGPYRFGVAIQNLVQWHSWSDDLVTVRYQVLASSDSVATGLDRYPHDPATAHAPEQLVAAALVDDAHFPRRLRLAVGREGERTTLGAGYVLAGPGRIDKESTHLASIGAELRPFRVLSVQAGAATSFDDLHRLTVGTGVRFNSLYFDLAVSRLLGSDDRSGYTLGVGLSLNTARWE